MSSLGKIKLVRTVVEVTTSPSARPKTIEARDCAAMGITNAGVLFDLKDKRRFLIPWTNVALVELEREREKPEDPKADPAKPKAAKGKSREG